MRLQRENLRMVGKLGVIALGMFAFGYALVPLYKAICEMTGINVLALTEREVRPLAIYFWRGTWTLLTWCELRQDFRNFRVDRITGLLRLNRHFEPTPGQELEDYICLMESQS